jgi:hypothetical protein
MNPWMGDLSITKVLPTQDEKTEKSDIHPCTKGIQTYQNKCCKMSPKGRQLQNLLTLTFLAV